MGKIFYLLGIWCLLTGTPFVYGQSANIAPATSITAGAPDSSYLIVNDIIIQGNKRTRTSIILRELSLAPGDTIRLKDLAETLEERRKQLLNISLFLNVTANIKNWNGEFADVIFEVWERWYTFPIPIFKLADRNFNQWWVEQGRSLDRVNIGVRLIQENMTGRRDDLHADIQFGYTQRFALGYNVPYFDKNYRHGAGILVSYSRNREVNESTSSGNKQQFFRNVDFQRQAYSIGLNYSYRKAINTRHRVYLSYNYEKVGDSVVLLNPDYLGKGRSEVRYLELNYRMNYIKADSWIYPLKGLTIVAEAGKKGIGPLSDIDDIRLRLEAVKYWQLAPKTFGALGIRSQAKFGGDQPYVNQKAIGYSDDYLRGLEYFVVDGTSYFIFKSTLRQELLSFKVHLPIVPKKFSTVPFRILAKTYADMGYAYNKFPKGATLDNRFLYSGGVGFDIVSFYDTCLRIEYSVNQLGQKGLFLHTQLDM